MLKKFMQEEEGQTLVEYGLLVALIALVAFAAITILGNKVSSTMNAASDAMVTPE